MEGGRAVGNVRPDAEDPQVPSDVWGVNGLDGDGELDDACHACTAARRERLALAKN